MITYNAKDLIQQATMLADLQNSDFISWKENIMFLDNAWTELYQSLINHGDKTYLQEFSFSGERTFLPDDFYQLYYVCYNNGTYEQPIARKAKTSTGQGPYYDIVGNELIIYRDSVSNMNKIKVQYYPVKSSITYSAPTKNLNIRDNLPVADSSNIYNWTDVCGKYALYTRATGSTASDVNGIYDLEKCEKYSGVGSSMNTLYLVGNTINVTSSTNNLLRYNNHLYNWDRSGNNFYIYRGTTQDVLLKTYRCTYDNYTVFSSHSGLAALLNDRIYFIKYDYSTHIYTLKCLNLATDTITDVGQVLSNNYTAASVYTFNDSVYYETVNGVYKDGNLILPADDYTYFSGVLKEDNETGYGMLIDKIYLHSVFENTELNFPNNFYYNYLAYKIAIYYKIKQNADPSGLLLMLAEAEKTFYDTLPRDENNFVRISNAYAY